MTLFLLAFLEHFKVYLLLHELPHTRLDLVCLLLHVILVCLLRVLFFQRVTRLCWFLLVKHFLRQLHLSNFIHSEILNLERLILEKGLCLGKVHIVDDLFNVFVLEAVAMEECREVDLSVQDNMHLVVDVIELVNLLALLVETEGHQLAKIAQVLFKYLVLLKELDILKGQRQVQTLTS